MFLKCFDCIIGLLFCYTGPRTYLVASVPGGYSKLGKGPLFREGKPRVQVLRFNLHNKFVF